MATSLNPKTKEELSQLLEKASKAPTLTEILGYLLEARRNGVVATTA